MDEVLDVLFKAKLLSVVKQLIDHDISELKNYVDQNLNKIPQINEIISSPRDPGATGERGRGIQRTSIVENNLVIQYDDGELINLGRVIFEGQRGIVGETGLEGLAGSAGPKGDKGDSGNTAPSVTSAKIFNEDLILFKDDGTNINAGKVIGPRGGKGEPGVIGEQGPEGLAGLMGPKGEIGDRGDVGATGKNGKDGVDGQQGPEGKPGKPGEQGLAGPAGLDGEQGLQGEKGEKGEKGDPGSSADVAPLEKKFRDLTKTLDTKISKIAYNASMGILGTSSGSGEVNLRSLDDVDYNSVRSPTNGQVLIYNQTLRKWQANTAAGGGDVTTAQFNSALANTNSFIKSQLANTNTFIATKVNTSTFNSALANTNTYIATKTNSASPTTSGVLAHTGRATISTNLTVSGNTVVSKLVANGSVGTAGYVLKSNGSTVYWDATSSGGGANTGMGLTLSTPTDSSLTTYGAYQGFVTGTKVTDAVDILNTVVYNIRNNSFVRSVTFTGSPLAGGAGTTVTLATTVDGTANQYEISWGDGSSNTVTASSSPTHVYSTNAGSPFSVGITARNTSGGGYGSSATFSRTEYITIYTATPAVSFGLYNANTGGSALTGNNLYVIEGTSLYMDNDTTNIGAATVAYTMNWGDDSGISTIASDSASGGTAGSRLQHTWGQGTNSGTGRDTLTLTLTAHSTALPGDIPATGTISLKVYDDAPAAPNGLSSKTLGWTSATTGTSPKLASGFTDNTGGAVYVAGNDVNRTTATTGTIDSDTLSTFAYNGDSGTISAVVNGSTSGSKVLDTNDNSGTYTSLIITSESDYNLLNATGTTVSFNSSIYYPGLYKGLKAKVAITASSLSTGVNSMLLRHTSPAEDTNKIEFAKDNMTANPTVSIASATLTEGTGGTKRYVSGIPYYNTGSPTLTLGGVTITNLVGQCYTNQTNIVEVADSTNLESTTAIVITDTNYTYATIDGSTTMLASGIPKVNIGTSSAYSIGSLTVPVTTTSVRSVGKIKVRSRNVNGIGSYTSDHDTIVQVHTSAQSGISEIAIAVSSSLGATYTDNGLRVFNFSAATTNNPSFNSATNFYTNSLYSESSDPGVSGTKEATIRIGILKYDVTNYSTGYLPAGPNRSGDTGTQYFTFAFRRAVVSNFDINITSTGIAGLWIAAPGTAIDSASGLNGWINASTTYNGSGVPGSNTGSGGNGSDGCASTSGDRIQTGTSLSGGYTMTLGTENMSNATNNVVLVRIALTSGQSVTALSIGVAA